MKKPPSTWIETAAGAGALPLATPEEGLAARRAKDPQLGRFVADAIRYITDDAMAKRQRKVLVAQAAKGALMALAATRS